MDMFEEAKSLAVMMKMRSLSQKEAAKMLGVSQSYVANKLRLLKLSPDLQEKVILASLSERHARTLLRLKEDVTRKIALDKICDQKLSVAESEALVDLLLMSEAKVSFQRGDMLKAIDTFLNSIKQSLNTICSFGAKSTSKIRYENGKVYISICIDEN